MDVALYEDFVRSQKGKVETFYYQELNPPDKSKVKLLEIRWTHDRVDGDLVFGEMNIEGLGYFETDAYLYRTRALENATYIDDVWLALTRTEPVIGPHEQRFLTGGPIHKKPLLPSEIHASADPRSSGNDTPLPRIVFFNRDEVDKLARWKNGMEQKGFKCSSSEIWRGYKTYVEDFYSGQVVFDIERDGLDFNIEVRRLKTGLFSSNYQIFVSDNSYRRSRTNPDVINATPRSTQIVNAKVDSFDKLRAEMDKAVDLVVERNLHFIQREC
jgi:hypothetical protein